MQLEAEAKAREELAKKEEVVIPEPEQMIEEEIIQHPTFKEITFSVVVTKEQLELLTDFMLSSDITFKQV